MNFNSNERVRERERERWDLFLLSLLSLGEEILFLRLESLFPTTTTGGARGRGSPGPTLFKNILLYILLLKKIK